MKNNVKKVLGFIFLKSAFTSRNLTSLGLVAIFFGVYIASGGKIASMPSLQAGGSFGGIKNPTLEKNINPSIEDITANSGEEDQAEIKTNTGLFGKESENLDSIKLPEEDLDATKQEENQDKGEEDERLNSLLNRLEGMEEKK